MVIDLSERWVIQTMDFGHGVRPHGAVFGPKDGLLYVTTELDNAVIVIDPHPKMVGASPQKTESQRPGIVGKIPTGQEESHMLAISPDGRYGILRVGAW